MLPRHPHNQGAFARLWTPLDQACAAMDLPQGFALGDEQREFLPLCNPDQPSADWMPSSSRRRQKGSFCDS